MAKGVNPGKDWCEMSKIVIYFSTGDTYFGKYTLIYSSWITVDYAYVYILAKITLISFNLCLQNGHKKEICLYIMHQELHTAVQS